MTENNKQKTLIRMDDVASLSTKTRETVGNAEPSRGLTLGQGALKVKKWKHGLMMNDLIICREEERKGLHVFIDLERESILSQEVRQEMLDY